MSPLALWRHEVRRAGWAALLVPPVTAGLTGLLGVLDAVTAGGDVSTARTLHAVLEQAIPLSAGIAAASLIGRDPAAELQLTVFRDYRVTLLRRLGIAFGWAAVIAVVTTVLLVVSGWWYRLPAAPGPVAGQLTWLAPALALVGIGFLAGAVLRGPAAASGVVAGVWVLRQLVQGGFWTREPVELVAGAVFLGAAWWVLAGTERLVRGEDG
jgi:hypothetical protein